MTAATPAPDRDSPGTPDGRTSSGPADAATPGQAAYEAPFRVIESHERVMRAAQIDIFRGDPAAAQHLLDQQLDGWDGPDWSGAETGLEWLERVRADERAIAAREPHAADGNAPELRITDCSAHGDALHIQVNTGHNWLCAVALAAILAEYEPQPEVQPAPGIPLRSDAETCDMLRADLADYEAQLARWPKCPAGCSCRIGIADDADANECGCDGPCNGGPQPAPELAAAKPDLGTAWRLLNETREQLALLQDSIGNLAAGLKLSADVSRPSKKTEIEDGCAAALLAILDPL